MKLNMRKIKFYMFVVIAIVLLFGVSYLKKDKDTFTEQETEIIIPTVNIIDQKIVIKELIENLQVVGLESDIEKVYKYKDSKWFGDKEFSMKLNGTFKMGFNINDIKRENIIITDNNDVIIEMPEMVLISLELPYDKIKINKDIGLLRKDFSENDRQLLYSNASDSIKEEILNDTNIRNNAIISSQNAIKQILTLIPEVNNVSFK